MAAPPGDMARRPLASAPPVARTLPWHDLVVAPVDEEGRRIAGVDAGNGREVTVALGHGVLGATEKSVHSSQVTQGGETGQVGGRIECCHRSHPSIWEVK